jgi:riboflavin kinase/FMN adenylyltransferase
MQYFRTLDPIHVENSWVTIGSFDGVHLGHQRIIRQLVADTQANHQPVVVITFFPHPAVVLGKSSNGGYLTTPEERADLLGSLGVDYVITLPFTRELSTLTALEFMKMLTDHLQISHLFVGYDFALGRQREGNVERLREIGAQLGYQLTVFEPVESGSLPISSSQIRQLIRAGKVKQAAELLGRLYAVEGTVVHGDGRGKLLGFPTANIDYWEQRVMPATGIYATWVTVDGKRCRSVTNFGLRPTFENTPPAPLLETHIMDFSDDLYGKQLHLEFSAFLRPEKKFASVEELILQMNRDKQDAWEVLENEQ